MEQGPARTRAMIDRPPMDLVTAREATPTPVHRALRRGNEARLRRTCPSFVRQARLRPHCEPCQDVKSRAPIEIDHPPRDEIQWDWFDRRGRTQVAHVSRRHALAIASSPLTYTRTLSGGSRTSTSPEGTG